MFRKLVAHVSFSPSLVSELGFYATRLKREESIRKIGFIITILALIVQLFSVWQPPESANTANSNDIILGGVQSKGDFFSRYDRNEENIRDIYTSLGVTRAEIQAATKSSISSRHTGYIAGRTSQLSFMQGERPYQYEKQAGGSGTVYFSPLDQLNVRSPSKTYDAWIGQSIEAGRFAIILASGNIALPTLPTQTAASSCTLNPHLSSKDALCQPCPSDLTQWIKAPTCTNPVLYSKVATNNTKNQSAQDNIAVPSDRITYTIRAKNIGATTVSVPFIDQLHDVLEYADVIDTHGGTFDVSTSTLAWQDAPIEPGQSISRSFSVRLKSHLPATAQGISNPNSYDCVMTNTHTNTINIAVLCPVPKVLELAVTDLPPINSQTNLLVGGGVFLVVSYFYARARQQREELRLIRKDINIGTL